MSERESRQEVEARQALEAHLESSEELLAYVSGNLFSSTNQPYHIGLTQERLVLVRKKGGKASGEVYSIRRAAVKSVKWASLGPSLQVSLPMDKVDVRLRGRWRKRAKALARLFDADKLPAGVELTISAQEQLQQARDFQALGLLASSQGELDKALKRDSTLGTDPEVLALEEQLSEARLALRVGAGFLFVGAAINLCLTLVFALVGGVEAAAASFAGLISYVIDIGIGIGLWQGRMRWRVWALLRAVLGFLFLGVSSIAQGDFVALILQAAFSGAVILVLTGESNRTRTMIAVGIYAVGYVALLLAVVLGPFVLGTIGSL